MIEVKIDTDVREYKEKIVLNLSFRQLVCSVIALIISIYLFYIGVIVPEFLSKNGVNNATATEIQVSEDKTELISWVIIGVVMPIMFVGFFSYNGMTVEKFVWCFLKDKILPRRRVYRLKYNVHSSIYKKGGAKDGKD